ncbi:MAG: insulinase family protein [Bacteroidales bacterium]|nr:insulinase family protein [Bacteroidales bacterium]
MNSQCGKQYNYYTLDNGLRIVHKYDNTQVSHLGITIDAGSRDEKPYENGIAHFIEHCIFKGTARKPYYRILSRIDGVGGELNAYTTKEETVVYATFLNQYYERAAELLSDIVFNSIFPEKEIEKEKSVIIDEINSYEDSPSELIYDDFEQLVFGRTGLGRMILGTEEKVKSFSASMIRDFISRNWFTNKMVISTVGNIPFDKFVRLIEKYFSDVPARIASNKRHTTYRYIPKHIEENRDTYQTHVMIGNICYSYRNPKRVAFTLLNNMLGSNAMNSALNMHIREKYGNTYSIESSYTAYRDSGIFQIYAGCEEHFVEKIKDLIIKELENFKNKRLAQSSLSRGKQQLKGQLAIQFDGNQNEMLSIGKALLNYGRVSSLEDNFEDIDTITPKDILEVADEVFVTEKLSSIVYH